MFDDEDDKNTGALNWDSGHLSDLEIDKGARELKSQSLFHHLLGVFPDQLNPICPHCHCLSFQSTASKSCDCLRTFVILVLLISSCMQVVGQNGGNGRSATHLAPVPRRSDSATVPMLPHLLPAMESHLKRLHARQRLPINQLAKMLPIQVARCACGCYSLLECPNFPKQCQNPSQRTLLLHKVFFFPPGHLSCLCLQLRETSCCVTK